ncbi:Rrf2 family transcriptional regulator [Caballeronia sp. LZ025]|uniref:RrF2 family transcriptional regulator n=1 Tax=Caballeronia TaxID=1827195 RepID=UPI001FD5D83E|nr:MULTISPECIES: Rrf2 family transcriptional regulator [Caballeronia]MDR5735820.1 Rrf2 family transcriptional regulator [Caballeronia sp. LZ025]
MAYFSAGVEYALHCLLWIARPTQARASSRDLAELQGVPVAYMAKIFPKLEKAGILQASEGIRGGYALARPAKRISVLDVADAIDGEKQLFDCQEVRARCALFEGDAPRWASNGVCEIHAVMLRAEKLMRNELAATTLADLVNGVAKKEPARFAQHVIDWFDARSDARDQARQEGVTNRRGKPRA